MRFAAEIILAAVFALLLTLIWMMYFVSPYDFIETLKNSHSMLIIGVVLFLFIFADLPLCVLNGVNIYVHIQNFK